MVESLLEKFKKLPNLKPNNEVNKLFTETYNYCINYKNECNLEINENVISINYFCSKGEYELEKFWANKIINSKNPKKELRNFIYYKNYEELVKLEYLNMQYFTKKCKNVLFVGGGSLPFTPILLAQKFNIKCKVIDYSLEAVKNSKELINLLGLENKIEIEYGDATRYKSNEKFDFVILASLIFLNGNQEEILNNITSNIKFKHAIVRSSDGIRQLLYKKVEDDILSKYFKIEFKIHPKNELVNSVILLSKK